MTDKEKFAELIEKLNPEKIEALIEKASELLEEENG